MAKDLYQFVISQVQGRYEDVNAYVVADGVIDARRILGKRFELDTDKGWIITEMKVLTGHGKPQHRFYLLTDEDEE